MPVQGSEKYIHDYIIYKKKCDGKRVEIMMAGKCCGERNNRKGKNKKHVQQNVLSGKFIEIQKEQMMINPDACDE